MAPYPNKNQWYDLRQVGREEFGHTKSTDPVSSKNLGHFLVWDKELLVLRVLEVIFLNISPELLNAFSSTGLFFANNVSELRAELHRFGKSGSLRHFEELLSFVLSKDWKILVF
jgi:hypothetical protein